MESEKTTVDEIIEKAKTSESAGGASFMDPQPKVAKKGRGRPKGSTSDKKSSDEGPKISEDVKKGPQIESKVFCYPIVKVMSIGAVSYTKDPRAACTPQEAENLSETMGALFDKHLPDMLQHYGVEAAFILALGQWGMRLVAIKKLQTEAMKKQAESEAQSTKMRPQEATSFNDLAKDVTPMPI